MREYRFQMRNVSESGSYASQRRVRAEKFEMKNYQTTIDALFYCVSHSLNVERSLDGSSPR